MRLPLIYDIEAEEKVVRGCMAEENNAIEAMSRLEEFHFGNNLYRGIFAGVCDLLAASRAVTPRAIAERLCLREEFQGSNSTGLIEELSGFAGSYIPSYEMDKQIERLLAKRVHREFILAVANAAEEIKEDPEKADGVIESLQAKVLEMQLPKSAKKLAHIKEAIPEVIEQIRKIKDGEIEPGLPTGFYLLDELIQLMPGEMTVIAARPGMGKTAFALALAKNIAAAGDDVAIFSMEMNKQALITRLLSSEAQIHGVAMRRGELSDDDFEEIKQTAKRLEALGIFIDDTAFTSIGEIASKARKLKIQNKKLKAVVIDYIQLINPSGKRKSENRVQDVSEISRGAKLLSMTLDLPVIALSQLSRAVEMRQNKRPMLSDLRESGSIEQDADNVIFIYRDEYYNPESEKRGEAEIIVSKQRNGPTGTVDLLYHNATFMNKARLM